MREGPPLAAVGVDTGGTFTDLIALVGGEVRTHKVLSTPRNPAEAVLRGLRELLPAGVVPHVTYGSTVATNALLERTGARVVLLTTRGFEDVLEIGRQNRSLLYELEPHRPSPLVPAARRLGITERTLHDGRVLVPLRAVAMRKALAAVRRLRPEAVAVCLLHAYANPCHERRLGAALARRERLFCSLSHTLTAEYREYERTSTTVVNAYVGPVMRRHLTRLTRGLSGTRLRVMQSNGGAISARLAAREAVRTALSGPAAGVIAARNVARSLGLRRVITFDMGGTSTDVSLIDGAIAYRTEWEIAGLPLQVPAIDIHTVGAGGGSLAHVDVGGLLKVGPESAGAEPGPACYGIGMQPTVTDANAVLGRLAADGFLGGRMRLDVARARTALRLLGQRLRRSPQAVAAGVVRVVNAGMERAIRRISVERGHDPRDYALIAFGGAAGQHACELAGALGIHRVVVPRHPGLLSAWGAAGADVQRDYVRTVRLPGTATGRLRGYFADLGRDARRALAAEGVAAASLRLRKSVDVRYVGQSHAVAVPFGPRFAAAFHAAHRRLYGYADAARPLEVVNVRLRALGTHPPAGQALSWSARPAPPRQGRTFWSGHWIPLAIHARDRLPPDAVVTGPAIITEFSATTFLPPAWQGRVHRTGHLLLTDAH